jgi:arginyl-tRNA synthetase
MSALPPVQEALSALVADAVAALVGEPTAVVVNKTKAGRGSSDYQTPTAMQLARVLRRKPRDIAADVVAKIVEGGSDLVEAPDIAGPGFIGLRLSDVALGRYLAHVAEDPRCGATPSDGSCVVIDFSSPNVAKRMHIGHIRSTGIGDALRRIGTFLGFEVIGDNHIGDWGTQFGQLIHAWRNWRDEAAYDDDPVGELERMYVEFHARAKDDESLHDAARAELAKLQAGDPDNMALWERMRADSQHVFDSIYERLGVEFTVTYGESHYRDMLVPLVDRLVEQGIAEPSDGAICVFFRDEEGENTMTPFLIRKRDGASLYATSDLATIELRIATWKPSRMIYVTDHRQSLHFQQLFATAKKMGVEVAMTHVGFGLMKLPSGPFAARSGNVIRLDELLDEAERRARANLEGRSGPGGVPFTEEEMDSLARSIGIGAVKWADLANNPQSDIIFSFDKMLSLEGNTAPYLMYTAARTASLARRARAEANLVADGTTLKLVHEAERDLFLHVLGFGKAAWSAWDQGKPSVLATFLYELAAKFHRFWAACPVLQAGDDTLVMSRLNVSAVVRKVLATGLNLLGIDAPERM